MAFGELSRVHRSFFGPDPAVIKITRAVQHDGAVHMCCFISCWHNCTWPVFSRTQGRPKERTCVMHCIHGSWLRHDILGKILKWPHPSSEMKVQPPRFNPQVEPTKKKKVLSWFSCPSTTSIRWVQIPPPPPVGSFSVFVPTTTPTT